MEQIKPIVEEDGNTTIIIHPPSARTKEDIEQVISNLDAALYKAWLNIQ